MNQTGAIYALIASVGDYRQADSISLPSYEADRRLICHALTDGLKMDKEHIRIAGEEGYLSGRSLALCLKDFIRLLQEQDTFLFYFSGHGIGGNILLSDDKISLVSVINYIDQLPARTKLIFLDCCHAGDFHKPAARQMEFMDTLERYIGHGTAILASSSAGQVSRLGPGGESSLFTTFLAASLQSQRLLRQGMLSIHDVKDHIRFLMGKWTETHPDQEQIPVFRSNILGDIRFPVSPCHPYVPRQIRYETKDYILCSVKGLSTQIEKRLAAFLILKGPTDHKTMVRITRDVVRRIRHAEVYQDQINEDRYTGKPAQVIWCYMGKDESDIVRGVHYAHTIWADSPGLRKKYYRNVSSSYITRDICIVINESYEMIRRIQDSAHIGETAQYEQLKKLLIKTISMAEDYISDLHEVENRTITPHEFHQKYDPWSREVRKMYLKMTDYPVPPVPIHDYAEKVMSMAGWILDIALIMEKNKDRDHMEENDLWLIKHAVRSYYEEMEKIPEV